LTHLQKSTNSLMSKDGLREIEARYEKTSLIDW